MKLLLITPPLTQINTPYPATTMLKAYMQAQGHPTAQADLGIELVDRLYSRAWLSRYAEQASDPEEKDYLLHCSEVVEPVKAFLRGEDNTLASRIANRTLLPEGARFDSLTDLEWAFGTSGTEDKARHLATLFIEDIADYLRTHADAHFDLIRYAEEIANYAPTFDELYAELSAPASLVDRLMLDLLEQHLETEKPGLVGFTIPFPGCLYGALRCAQHIKQRHHLPVVLGGGFVNTEWRQLSDTRIFDFCDYITYDDGELPLLRIVEHLEDNRTTAQIPLLGRNDQSNAPPLELWQMEQTDDGTWLLLAPLRLLRHQPRLYTPLRRAHRLDGGGPHGAHHSTDRQHRISLCG